MHMVIRAIVYAENEEEAICEGRRVFEQLVDDKHFDYYTLFGTEEDNYEMSGTSRWGALPTVVPADSLRGQLLIIEGMVFTENALKEHLDKLRERLGTNPAVEELIEDDTWRWHCYQIGRYHGYEVWLYDHDGEGIRMRSHLSNALDKWRCNDSCNRANPYEGLSVYVVPADVHT